MDKLFPAPVADADGGFQALRRKAQKVLMQHGFPHRKTENWKYEIGRASCRERV